MNRVSQASSDGWCRAQRLVRPAEIVEHEVQRQRVAVIVKLL